MNKQITRLTPFAILCIFLVSQLACRASEYLGGTDTSPPIMPPTEESEPEAPQPDSEQVEMEGDIEPPVEVMPNLGEISSSNAAELVELNTIRLSAPLADYFIAPEVEGYSLWVALLDDGSAPAHLENWDLYSNQMIGEMASGELVSPKSLSGTPDGGMLVTLDESSVALWDVFHGKLPFAEIEPSPWLEEALIPHNTGMLLAIGYASTDGSLVLFDLNTYQIINVWFHEDYISDIDFSTDGVFLVSGAANGTVKVIDVDNAVEAFSISEDGWVDSVAVEVSPSQSAGSGHIMATSTMGTITLWDTTTRSQIGEFAGHPNDVVQMDFSPNGEVIASGDRNGTLKLWDVVSGNELFSVNISSDEIVRVTFSMDGTLLAAGTVGGTITLWSILE